MKIKLLVEIQSFYITPYLIAINMPPYRCDVLHVVDVKGDLRSDECWASGQAGARGEHWAGAWGQAGRGSGWRGWRVDCGRETDPATLGDHHTVVSGATCFGVSVRCREDSETLKIFKISTIFQTYKQKLNFYQANRFKPKILHFIEIIVTQILLIDCYLFISHHILL